MFVSNNSTKTTQEYITKMKKFGYDGRDNIYGSARVTAQYMLKHHPNIKKVFVVGTKALRLELEGVGI